MYTQQPPTRSAAPHASVYHVKHIKPSLKRVVLVNGADGADLIDTMNKMFDLRLKPQDWHVIAPKLTHKIIHTTQGETGIPHYRLNHFGPLSDTDKLVFLSFDRSSVRA